MTEFRKDAVIGQWVIVHTDDSWKPQQYEKEEHYFRQAVNCQFCPGKEHFTPPEIDAIRDGSWKVRVVSNKFPALRIEGDINRCRLGIYDVANGVGAHEVVIETPDHHKGLADFEDWELDNVLKIYQNRLIDLARDKRFKYIIIFKNYGESAGTSVEHPHSQIIALPMVPQYVCEELHSTQEYYKIQSRCIFCDILKQEYNEQKRIITENDNFVAVTPYAPRYPFESWILPRKHSSDLASITNEERLSFARILKDHLMRMKVCLSDPSYNFYLHVSPVNYEGGKSYHWHLELIPRLTHFSGFEWGSGFHVVRTSPEDAAKFLREASVAAKV